MKIWSPYSTVVKCEIVAPNFFDGVETWNTGRIYRFRHLNNWLISADETGLGEVNKEKLGFPAFLIIFKDFGIIINKYLVHFHSESIWCTGWVQKFLSICFSDTAGWEIWSFIVGKSCSWWYSYKFSRFNVLIEILNFVIEEFWT